MPNNYYSWPSCSAPCDDTSCSKDCSTSNNCKTCNTCEHYSFLNEICMNPKITGIKPKKNGNDTCNDWEKCS
jgi:hypothetical protein